MITRQDDIQLPQTGQAWMHHPSGVSYIIIGLAVDTATDKITVVYRAAGTVDGILFVRALDLFLGSTPDKEQRFTRIG